MRKITYLLAISFCLLSAYSCKEECVTCSIAGAGETICESELDVYNVLNGTNFTSLDQYVGTIEGLGGSCN